MNDQLDNIKNSTSEGDQKVLDERRYLQDLIDKEDKTDSEIKIIESVQRFNAKYGEPQLEAEIEAEKQRKGSSDFFFYETCVF